jgi:hypothetical protein
MLPDGNCEDELVGSSSGSMVASNKGWEADMSARDSGKDEFADGWRSSVVNEIPIILLEDV